MPKKPTAELAMKKEIREQVKQKFGGRCAYCGKKLPEKGWHVDHIDPLLRGYEQIGGADAIENLNPACRRCNLWKGAMSLEEFRSEIEAQAERLRRDSAGFRMAEDFEIVTVTYNPVEFWHEKI